MIYDKGSRRIWQLYHIIIVQYANFAVTIDQICRFMSIHLFKILKRMLPVPFADSVSMIKESVSTSKNSDSTSEKNHAIQFDGSESTDSKLESLPRLSSQVLITVFRKAECCTLDGLNEYDEDFTSFTPLGDLVTHEMQQAADRLAKQVSDSSALENSATEVDHATIVQASFNENQ